MRKLAVIVVLGMCGALCGCMLEDPPSEATRPPGSSPPQHVAFIVPTVEMTDTLRLYNPYPYSVDVYIDFYKVCQIGPYSEAEGLASQDTHSVTYRALSGEDVADFSAETGDDIHGPALGSRWTAGSATPAKPADQSGQAPPAADPPKPDQN